MSISHNLSITITDTELDAALSVPHTDGAETASLAPAAANDSPEVFRLKRRTSLRPVSLNLDDGSTSSSTASGKPSQSLGARLGRRSLNRSLVSSGGGLLADALEGGGLSETGSMNGSSQTVASETSSGSGRLRSDDDERDDETSTVEPVTDSLRINLEKAPKERTADDVKFIVKELENTPAFGNLKPTARRELCGLMTLKVFPEQDTLVDLTDEYCNLQWWAILKGSVDVIVDGDIVSSIREGESFGHDPIMVEGVPRTDVTIMTAEDNCELVTVPVAEYERILKLIESNTTRVEENGQVVLVLEKRASSDPNAELQTEVVVHATVDKLFERLCLDAQHSLDKFFVSDFFLTYRTFISSEQVIERLIARFSKPSCVKPPPEGGRSEAGVVAFCIMFWLNNLPVDFISKQPMLDGLAKLEAYLVKYEMNKELRQLQAIKEQSGLAIKVETSMPILQKTLSVENASDPGMMAKLFKRKSSFAGRFLTRGSKDEKSIASGIMAAAASAGGAATATSLNASIALESIAEGEVDVVKIYRGDLSHKYILVRKTTTASEVVAEALEQFGIKSKSESEYSLVQVWSSEKASMVRPTQDNLAATLSINARLYLRHNLNPERFPAPESIAVEGESQILNMDPAEIARQLTLEDSQLFRDIHTTEYVEHLWKLGDKKCESLNKFVDRFNLINFWVVNEILMTKDVKRRVDLIRVFLAVAKYLRQWKNFNSLFAVISGLTNTAITRLRETWEKVPKRLAEYLAELEGLMNPSRNMGVYRNLLLGSAPPLTPFFPLLMKDLVFIHEGNPSKVDGMINFEKLRMIARTLRLISDMCLIAYDVSDLEDAESASLRKALRMGTNSSSIFKKMYESTRMKYYVTEYFRELKVEREQPKLNDIASTLEKSAGTLAKRRNTVQIS